MKMFSNFWEKLLEVKEDYNEFIPVFFSYGLALFGTGLIYDSGNLADLIGRHYFIITRGQFFIISSSLTWFLFYYGYCKDSNKEIFKGEFKSVVLDILLTGLFTLMYTLPAYFIWAIILIPILYFLGI